VKAKKTFFYSSTEEKKHISDGLWVSKLTANFHFWENYL